MEDTGNQREVKGSVYSQELNAILGTNIGVMSDREQEIYHRGVRIQNTASRYMQEAEPLNEKKALEERTKNLKERYDISRINGNELDKIIKEELSQERARVRTHNRLLAIKKQIASATEEGQALDVGEYGARIKDLKKLNEKNQVSMQILNVLADMESLKDEELNAQKLKLKGFQDELKLATDHANLNSQIGRAHV